MRFWISAPRWAILHHIHVMRPSETLLRNFLDLCATLRAHSEFGLTWQEGEKTGMALALRVASSLKRRSARNVMRHLLYGAVLMVAGCGQSARDPAPKPVMPTVTPVKVAVSPNILFFKCTGEGTSFAKMKGMEAGSDPADEETYFRANIRDQTLQMWIVGKWSEACEPDEKCIGTFSKSRLDYRSAPRERASADEININRWSISRSDGRYSHVEDIENRPLKMTRKVTIRGTCAKVDEPAPDQSAY